jgi:hypothetical protein
MKLLQALSRDMRNFLLYGYQTPAIAAFQLRYIRTEGC